MSCTDVRLCVSVALSLGNAGEEHFPCRVVASFGVAPHIQRLYGLYVGAGAAPVAPERSIGASAPRSEPARVCGIEVAERGCILCGKISYKARVERTNVGTASELQTTCCSPG